MEPDYDLVYQYIDYYPYTDDGTTWGVFLLPCTEFAAGSWWYTDSFDEDGNLLGNQRLVTSRENAETALSRLGPGYQIREYTEDLE